MQQLHFETHGNVGPHLLLVHGFLMSRAQWLPNLRALSQVCRTVVVELFGHGRSDAPSDPAAYHPDAYVAAFEDIRRSLGAERWWLCGYSLGAGLTIRYALTHPQRIFGQAFTNSTSAFADAAQTEAWKNGAADAAAKIETGGLDAIERMPVHPRHAKRLPRDLYDALMIDAARLSPIGIANTLINTNPNATIRARVGENVVPSLLICGREETRFGPHRDYAQAHMPNLSIVDLAVGHGVNMEDADGFNRALVDFVTGKSR